ncbi:hypothetical protein [Streptomyces coelicoflavus]|uniref:hypothetical protein n=1 Tax=Streptomyces coelicoflavus TaxID=285562 RepID=UPI0036B04EB3
MELEQRFRRHASVTDVVVEVLRERRSAPIEDTLMVKVQGVATVNNSENVKAIERRVTELTDVAAKEVEILRPATMRFAAAGKCALEPCATLLGREQLMWQVREFGLYPSQCRCDHFTGGCQWGGLPF